MMTTGPARSSLPSVTRPSARSSIPKVGRRTPATPGPQVLTRRPGPVFAGLPVRSRATKGLLHASLPMRYPAGTVIHYDAQAVHSAPGFCAAAGRSGVVRTFLRILADASELHECSGCMLPAL